MNFQSPSNCTDYIDQVIDSADIKLFKKSLQALPENSEEQEEDFEFLQEIFRGFSRSYSVVQNIYDGEATFNSLLIYPFLEAIANGVTVNHCGAELKVGEPVLKSMSKQLKELGLQLHDKSQYKADGIIKLFKMKEIEMLFLETSGSFGNKDKVKINFDHHKGTFGSLAILKTIADEFCFASVDTFKTLKIFFLYAADTKLHLWSVSFCKEGFFELWREEFLDISPLFEDRLEFLPRSIQFFWNMRALLKETVSTIAVLKEEHLQEMPKWRYTYCPFPTLSKLVNPLILKLVHEEDSTGMADMGPFYTLTPN
ncbi:hypothetical protein G6F57_011588 [Rhizopus arrhizus]|uniref:Uncharacterized protein n=1 Tax=Rhizopus oryzae TaxID=64495 RepID=A0A9P6X3B2_RHIOR|nr:hypothetical protein G6F30_009639 [Rhizopus arrhizus]KAG1406231.1 hypothetical protein G6F58_009872 [Rhizopus delemar]KAG0978203.1 hypothetical protein G6F29_009489 [Rhizopus arrhizus]KAG0988127.1 hypothetical protein G6F28_009859 [Rhizopus arrhizus]KAG1004664.1 hypothetical protein G6F27_009931 [Rhizopus arrhizus]